MGGKKNGNLEKKQESQKNDIGQLTEKVSGINDRLERLERAWEESQKTKKSTYLSVVLACVGIFSVVFAAGRFVQKFETYMETVDRLDVSMKQLQLANDIVCIQLPEEAVLLLDSNEETGDRILAPLDWTDETIVDEGGNITAEDLIGKQILATYEVDGVRTAFYGSYNQAYHWQGDCRLNSYDEEDELIFVMEALYEDGEALSYKQFYADEDEHGEPYWLFSKRIASEEGNQGESWIYRKDFEIRREFDWSLVTPKAMYTTEDVMDRMDAPLRSYYKGATKDGLYNDATGDALLVLFDEEGYVKTLYQGRFVNGKMADATGLAWEITSNPEKDIPYMYQQGVFADGKCTESTAPTETDLSREQIENLLQQYGLDNVWSWRE